MKCRRLHPSYHITDMVNAEGMYILTCSQNMKLMQAVDEILAGRVGILNLLPPDNKNS